MAESEEELKSFLMNMEEGSQKAGLKLNIQKTKVMASSTIISWQIDQETMETVTDFIFLGSKITAKNFPYADLTLKVSDKFKITKVVNQIWNLIQKC